MALTLVSPVSSVLTPTPYILYILYIVYPVYTVNAHADRRLIALAPSLLFELAPSPNVPLIS